MKQTLHLTLLFFLVTIVSFGQGKLKKAEESLKKQNSTTKGSIQNGSGLSDTDDNFGEMLVKETFDRLAISIFTYSVYGLLVEMPFEKESLSSNAILTKYPYFNSNNGNYSYKWNENSIVGRTTISARYISENSRIKGNHLNFDFHFYNKLGAELNYLQLWENNPNWGEYSLALYSAFFKYHRIRTKHLNGWWKIGGTYVDGTINQWGGYLWIWV